MKKLELNQMEIVEGGTLDWASISGFTCGGVGLVAIATIAGAATAGFGAIGILAIGTAACSGSLMGWNNQ